MFEALARIGLVALCAGAAATIYFYVRCRTRLAPERMPSIARYFGAAVLIGIGSYVAGTMLGILGACFKDDAGNLCGLYGVFGVGPLLAGIALFLHGLSWNRRAGRSP